MKLNKYLMVYRSEKLNKMNWKNVLWSISAFFSQHHLLYKYARCRRICQSSLLTILTVPLYTQSLPILCDHVTLDASPLQAALNSCAASQLLVLRSISASALSFTALRSFLSAPHQHSSEVCSFLLRVVQETISFAGRCGSTPSIDSE